jgi:hypothetical protein
MEHALDTYAGAGWFLDYLEAICADSRKKPSVFAHNPHEEGPWDKEHERVGRPPSKSFFDWAHSVGVKSRDETAKFRRSVARNTLRTSEAS